MSDAIIKIYASQDWVENAIANIPEVDMSEYATETYVDDAISELSSQNPTVELDTTLTVAGKAADAKAVGDALKNLSVSGLTTAQVNALDGMFKVCAFTKADVSAEYNAFKTAFGISDSGGEEEPDEPVTPEKTLTGISATYSGGDVAVGTAVSALTGIVVTAHYSDGTSATVTGYTLSGEIAEGSNTVTVTYQGKTATVTVTGVAESGGEEEINWYTLTPADFTEPVTSGNTIFLKKCDITDPEINAIIVPATMTNGDTTYATVNTYQLKFDPSANIEYLKFEPGVVVNADVGITIPTATIKQVIGLDNLALKKVPSFTEAANLIEAPLLPTTITETSNTNGIFANCDSLTDVSDFVIPASLATVGSWFAQCDNLEYGCTIPATVTAGTTQFYWRAPKLRHARVESLTCPVSGNFVTDLVNECEIELYSDSAFFTEMRNLAYAYNGIDRHVYLTPIAGTINSVSAFGDSLTQGQITSNYPKALTEKLSANSIVWNMGVSASTMEQQLQRMKGYPQKMKADVIIQWGGTNASAATQSVENYTACLDEMISLFRTDKYIIITPTDHTYNADRDAACAEKYGVHYLNLTEYFESKGYTRSDYQTDGIHFTADGYGIVAQAIYEKGQALGYWE